MSKRWHPSFKLLNMQPKVDVKCMKLCTIILHYSRVDTFFHEKCTASCNQGLRSYCKVGGGRDQILASFFPCNATANVKFCRSWRDSCSPPPPPLSPIFPGHCLQDASIEDKFSMKLGLVMSSGVGSCMELDTWNLMLTPRFCHPETLESLRFWEIFNCFC